jgi:hypothetical protein
MRVYRFSILLIFITSVALLYVHQQVLLLKVSYNIQDNEKEVATLLDQNRSLMYTITKMKSPVYLGEKFLTSRKDFRVAERWQIVEAAPAGKVNRAHTSGKEGPPTRVAKNSIIDKLFGKPKEAMANTIK